MPALTRDEFLKADPLPTEKVEIPGKGYLLVRGLTGAEYDEYEVQCVKTVDGKPVFRPDRARIVQFGAVGEDGKRLFTPEDVPALAGLLGGRLNAAANAIHRLTGLSGGDDAPGKG